MARMTGIPDPRAEAADRRQLLLATLEVKARTFTGQVVCTTCRRPLVGDESCGCQTPTVNTPRQVIVHLSGVIEQTRAELAAAGVLVETLQGDLALAEARASEAEAIARLARMHATDMEAAMAFHRDALHQFVEKVQQTIGRPVRSG